MDVGIGASAIYPLVAHADYGWSFIGTDVSVASLGLGSLAAGRPATEPARCRALRACSPRRAESEVRRRRQRLCVCRLVATLAWW